MTRQKYNSKQREPVIAEKQELLKIMEQQAKALAQANKLLKKTEENVKKMTEYYFNDWLDDYNYFKSENYYEILSQDHIHNVLQEIYIQKIKLLKKIVSKI